MTGELTDDDIRRMTTPLWEQVRAAILADDIDDAAGLLDKAVAQWRSLQDYSINWITSLLSFIGEELGEEAVERALRRTGDEFVAPRRAASGVGWGSLPASARAKVIARAMVSNFATCDVEEDDEKITLSFDCGTGGRLVNEGRYDTEGGPYLTLRERAPRTFMGDSLPVYCAHCSINNELQPLERGEAPTSIEHPTTRRGERCVHHVYKRGLPSSAYERLGLPPR